MKFPAFTHTRWQTHTPSQCIGHKQTSGKNQCHSKSEKIDIEMNALKFSRKNFKCFGAEISPVSNSLEKITETLPRISTYVPYLLRASETDKTIINFFLQWQIYVFQIIFELRSSPTNIALYCMQSQTVNSTEFKNVVRGE